MELGSVSNEPCQRLLKGKEAWLKQELQSMQELLAQERIGPELHVCLLVQTILQECFAEEDKLPN